MLNVECCARRLTNLQTNWLTLYKNARSFQPNDDEVEWKKCEKFIAMTSSSTPLLDSEGKIRFQRDGVNG